MAACGSLQHIFEKPLPENPTFFIKPVRSVERPSSFTEIFGEFHFKETSSQQASPPASSLPISSPSSSFSYPSSETRYTCCRKNGGDGFSPRNYESLHLCTEGLGFESSDDVEELKNETNEDWQSKEEKINYSTEAAGSYNFTREFKRSRSFGGAFPPPISCIGKSGKPWVCFKSYREDGRFVLKEVRIPTQEFLHACREDGRLKLHFVQPSEEIIEEDEEGYYDDDEEREEENEDACHDDEDDENVEDGRKGD